MGGFKSDLVDFELTRDNCFICGKPATSREHVIPKWLQRKFNLWDHKITIPNLTSITYKQLVVSACKKCNNEIYGTLEEKVKNNTADEKEIWRWANKIHFGLRLKDQFLDFDRKKPGIKIGDIFKNSDPLETTRHFLHCVSGDFTCYPDPFGSVFKFEFETEQEFNLIHIINSSAIYICVGKQAYIVFVTDGQILAKDDKGFREEYIMITKSKNCSVGDSLFFYAKCIYYMERYTYSNPIMFSEKGITKMGRATLRHEKPLNKPLFRAICDRFGITWIDEDELNKQ